MEQPKVSVVIPVYNAEKYLDVCVESVVGQTYDNLEIILVDDGSLDKSPIICDDWSAKDARIKVIHKDNAGAGMARNSGIEAATGEYVTFVDSDDYIEETTVEKCVSAVVGNGSQLVMFGRVEVYPDGKTANKPIRTDGCFFSGKDVTDKILSGLLISERGYGVGVCGKLIDLNVIKGNGVKFRLEREVLSEDTIFLMELFPHLDAVSLLTENLYYYVQNEGSFSRTVKKEYQTMNDGFIMFGLDLCERMNYSDRVRNNLMARYQVYSMAGMKLIESSDMSEKEKNNAIRAVIRNNILQRTIKKEVLATCNLKSKLFWIFVKFKCLPVCKLMLKYKVKK